MVNFHVGINRYAFQEGSEEIIEKLVYDLNQIFGSKKCPFHPDEKWEIGVDLLKDGKLQFSSMKQNGCSYPLTLLDEDLTPYLDTLKIFPLPIQ
jgi:hypothetical protein